MIVCLALSYNSQLSCVLSSCPLCVCSYQQRCCPNVWCHIRHHCYWVSCLSRSYCRSPLCGPSRVAAVVSVVPSRKTLYENAVCPRLSSTSARFVCSTTRPPSFLQESLSLSLTWSAVILSNGMCVVISMFQVTFGRRGTSGAMSARTIEK